MMKCIIFIDHEIIYEKELKSLRVTVDTESGMSYSFSLRSPPIDRSFVVNLLSVSL